MQGRFLDANRTAYERLGYTREELPGTTTGQLDDPTFAPQVPERLRQIREQGVAVFESGPRSKDGTMMPVEVNSRLLDQRGRKVFYSVLRDITERRRAEQALRISQEQLREKLNNTPIAAAVTSWSPVNMIVQIPARTTAGRSLVTRRLQHARAGDQAGRSRRLAPLVPVPSSGYIGSGNER